MFNLHGSFDNNILAHRLAKLNLRLMYLQILSVFFFLSNCVHIHLMAGELFCIEIKSYIWFGGVICIELQQQLIPTILFEIHIIRI